MKKLLTFLLTLVMCMASLFSLTACTPKDEVVNIRTKTITVGFTIYEPMNYYDDNGVLVGFDTELALMVFNALGYEVKFDLIDWSQKYTELESGNIDCIWNGFTANAADQDGIARSEKVDFSDYYMQNAQCIVKKTTANDITSWADMANKTVAFESGSSADSLIKDKCDTNVNKKGVTSQLDALKEVNMGTADYAVVDVLLAEAYCGNGDYASLEVNEGIDIGVEYYAVGFKKGSELVDKVNLLFITFAELGMTEQLAVKYGVESANLLRNQ